jgi:hypothetical protein
VNSELFQLSIEPPPTSSDAAQFAKQVLSEVLSDPLEVLSARHMCCQCLPKHRSASLRSLLIKGPHQLRQFDCEDGLDAGV